MHQNPTGKTQKTQPPRGEPKPKPKPSTTTTPCTETQAAKPRKPNRQNRNPSGTNRKPKPTTPRSASPSHRINHHAGKPKPSNQPVLPSTTTFPTQTLPFRALTDPKRKESTERRESTEKKKEKKSEEMRGKEKNRVYILGGPSRRNVIFIRIQSKYKVYNSFLFVKSYCTLCKKFRDREWIYTTAGALISILFSICRDK